MRFLVSPRFTFTVLRRLTLRVFACVLSLLFMAGLINVNVRACERRRCDHVL